MSGRNDDGGRGGDIVLLAAWLFLIGVIIYGFVAAVKAFTSTW